MVKQLFFFLTLFSFVSYAQTPGDVPQTFGEFPGFENLVNTIAVQNDGKVLVGGNFTAYKGTTENRIIRINADGSKDTSFNTGTGFNNPVHTIAVQADGKILVGGYFNTYSGVTESQIIRLNTDGSKDTSFATGSGFNNGVTTITVQTDGKILVGGNFTLYNGATEYRIIRLNADGSKDTSFATGSGFNNAVSTIKVQTDGKILVGGNFTLYKGATEYRITRLNADGTKDTSFNSGIGFYNYVNTIAVQADGKILVGGEFTSYNGVTGENRIIRLNANGTKDTSFNSGTGFNNTVFDIALQSDGKILVAGAFTSYKGVIGENRIIRLSADGTKDISFNIGTGFDNYLKTIAVQTDGKILAGGFFTSYNGVSGENRIIRLNADGTKDTSFNTGTGFNNEIRTIAVQTDGKILVGGYFTSYNRVTENRIIRLNADGTKDTSFNTGTGFNDLVTTIKVQTDGKILVAGYFTSYNGVTENRIIRLNADGSKDISFVTGTGFNNEIRTIAIQTDGKILVAGGFTSYNGVTENRIIRLNADGSKDTSFITGTGFNGIVYTIAVQTDGKILVGGYFGNYNVAAVNGFIIRLNADGSKDTSFITGTGFNTNASTIAVQTDGKILVGGGFTSYNGATENRIIRLNADGSKDTSFATGTGFDLNIMSSVYDIVTQTDGKILVGGSFTSYNGATENRIIRLNADGSKDITFNTGTGFDYNVYTLALKNDGKILVGGSFNTYKGSNSSARIIELHSGVVLSTTNFNDANALMLYPNPVNEVLHIQSNDFSMVNAVKIYDLQGKLVLEDTNNVINVTKLSKGLYIVKVKTENGELSKKFIKE